MHREQRGWKMKLYLFKTVERVRVPAEFGFAMQNVFNLSWVQKCALLCWMYWRTTFISEGGNGEKDKLWSGPFPPGLSVCRAIYSGNQKYENAMHSNHWHFAFQEYYVIRNILLDSNRQSILQSFCFALDESMLS